jgi:hypothetical protein
LTHWSSQNGYNTCFTFSQHSCYLIIKCPFEKLWHKFLKESWPLKNWFGEANDIQLKSLTQHWKYLDKSFIRCCICISNLVFFFGRSKDIEKFFKKGFWEFFKKIVGMLKDNAPPSSQPYELFLTQHCLYKKG